MKNYITLSLLTLVFLNVLPANADVKEDANYIFNAVGQRNYGQYECPFERKTERSMLRGTCVVTRYPHHYGISMCFGGNKEIINMIKSGRCQFIQDPEEMQ